VIKNGRVVTPTDVLESGEIEIRGDRIHHVGATPSRSVSADVVDARGLVVMPGLIDLHGDDIEHHLHPRTNASVETRVAVGMADRSNAASGVTTKFHAISFEELPESNRTVAEATETARAIADADDLLVDNRVHARCELSDPSVEAVTDLLGSIPIDLVSIMHHTAGDGQLSDDDAFSELYVSEKGCNEAEATRLLDARRSTSTETLRRRAAEITDAALEAGAAVASHDDERAEDVERMADLGVEITEFPVSMEAAERAAELGLTTVMGAPNLVRGGSLWDNLSAERAIDVGVLDVLSSDYHPVSLLSAVFVETGESLPRRVRRVTKNPADAVGLTDRGRIREGARADLIVVDPEPTPTVELVLVGGCERFRTNAVGREAGR